MVFTAYVSFYYVDNPSLRVNVPITFADEDLTTTSKTTTTGSDTGCDLSEIKE